MLDISKAGRESSMESPQGICTISLNFCIKVLNVYYFFLSQYNKSPNIPIPTHSEKGGTLEETSKAFLFSQNAFQVAHRSL